MTIHQLAALGFKPIPSSDPGGWTVYRRVVAGKTIEIQPQRTTAVLTDANGVVIREIAYVDEGCPQVFDAALILIGMACPVELVPE